MISKDFSLSVENGDCPKHDVNGNEYRDGKLVSSKGNVNDLRRFGKGIYILNGVKVVVK